MIISAGTNSTIPMELLIKEGADVNISDPHGYTALFYAVQRNKFKQAKLLVESGADVNALVTPINRSCLIVAAVENGIECAKLLLKAGARVNIVDIFGRNALMSYSRILTLESHRRSYSLYSAEFLTLLVAAGETMDENCLEKIPPQHLSLPCLENNKELNCLMVLCRLRIRKHLIDIDKYSNLFIRIPHLGLPRSLAEFLIYNVSLELK